MDDISKRILEGTLSNDISVAELLRRQKTFAADSELPPELQARGQSFFNTALYTDTPATLREGREVVAILRRTMEAIGSLYLEHQQRQGSAQYSDDTGGEVMNGIEQTTEVEGKEDCMQTAQHIIAMTTSYLITLEYKPPSPLDVGIVDLHMAVRHVRACLSPQEC
jgi:hypothetical protein